MLNTKYSFVAIIFGQEAPKGENNRPYMIEAHYDQYSYGSDVD